MTHSPAGTANTSESKPAGPGGHARREADAHPLYVDPMELHQRDARYATLNLVTLPLWIFDIDHSRVHWANEAALTVWKAASLQELCSRDMAADMSESVAKRLKQYQADFISQGASFYEQWTLFPSGVPVPLKAKFKGIRLDDGRMAMLCEGRSVEFDTADHLRTVEALLHTAVMISLYDSHGQVLYRNPAARQSVNRLDETLQDRVLDAGALARLLAETSRSGSATLTLLVRTVHGERWHELSARSCRDAVTGHDAVLVSEADVSALKRTEARASFLAMHDSLTGLPNRSHVMQRFNETVGSIRASGQEAALVFIDLDHFKDINDTLGHAAGDDLLVQMSRRLRDATRSSDLVARLGGDEFLILIVSKDIRSEVDRVRTRLLRTVTQPLTVQNNEVRVTPSLGVALYPRDGNDIETLLRNADMAMYTAKERGRNDIAYYDEAMADAVRKRITLETELRRAFDRNEFEVHYQPCVASDSGHIYGAEALVRWNHPEQGLVSPDAFIPMCEEMGLIYRLGSLVFDQAVRQQVAWFKSGRDLLVSVNLSSRQFRDPDLVSSIAASLAAAGCQPARIQLEITESVLIGDDARPLEVLRALEAMGLTIALDDFGTGYSNLAYLHRFPIKTLKIDKAFIQGIDANLPLAELIVAMCRLMKLNIVAEGVETAEQLSWVSGQGIENYQGYLFSRPLDVAQFDQMLGAPPLAPSVSLAPRAPSAATGPAVGGRAGVPGAEAS